MAYSIGFSDFRCRSRWRREVRRTKSTAQMTKMVMEAVWNTIPASIRLEPRAVDLRALDSMEANPPPAACISREIKSATQKIQRYALGER